MSDKKKPKVVTDWEIDTISLVDHCPYCGVRDTEKPAKHPYTGEQCYHPTRLGGPLSRPVKGKTNARIKKSI